MICLNGKHCGLQLTGAETNANCFHIVIHCSHTSAGSERNCMKYNICILSLYRRASGTGSIPEAIGFFSLPNPSSHTMALGSTQPLTEMSTRNLPGGKRRPAHKADNIAAICEPIF
jgi:hypothetical protein